MRAELVQTRAASAGGCQESGDMAGNVPEAARARAEAGQLARENATLRETVLALHSELFGARLATKYLDKELAGRIQQLQLLGSDMRAELRDSLWAQVEAEILLQRHKTLVRVCRGTSPRPARPASPQRARPRTVRVRRSPHLGLGISVTGGREHGVPILISELEAGGPAALTGQLYVGDAILAINDVDLTQACHKEAVQALQSVKGDCALCVQYIATDDDDRLSEDNYRFPLYPEDGEDYCEERDGSGVTPTAPRTPEYNNRCDSEDRSCSESESRYDVYKHSPRLALPPAYTYPLHPAHKHPMLNAHTHPAPYPDYNNINNNLNILDMDDDSIKIEARLEMVKLDEPDVDNNRKYASPVRVPAAPTPIVPAAPTQNIPAVPTQSVPAVPTQSVPAAPTPNVPIPNIPVPSIPVPIVPATMVPASPRQNSSPRSTPVHLARTTLKKKRKAQDWRTKGAYSAVSIDGISSDEPAGGTVTGPTARGGAGEVTLARDWRTRGTYTALQHAPSSDDDLLDVVRSDEVIKNGSVLPKVPAPAEKETIISLTPTTTTVVPEKASPPAINSMQSTSAPMLTSAATSTSAATMTSSMTSAATTASVTTPTLIVTSSADLSTSAVQTTTIRRQSALASPLSVDWKSNKLNGDTKSRKEIKNFRIGSARRVEACSLLNGDGDPDFGTPV
ncbi:unnamed protein product [Colias eurytheme]|nr:unnamed protein product [Colias eurytheme]